MIKESVRYLIYLQEHLFDLATKIDPEKWDALAEDAKQKFMIDYVQALITKYPSAAGPQLLQITKQILPHLSLISPYEPPWQRYRLQKLVTELEMAGGGIDPSSELTFGILPMGSMNAITFQCPSKTNFVVAFNNGVFEFLNMMAGIVAFAIPITPQGTLVRSDILQKQALERAATAPQIQTSFDDLIYAYVVQGSASKAPYWEPPSNYTGLQTLLREAALMFILGHEIAHIRLDHLRHGVETPTQSVQFGQTNLTVINRLQHQEFEADRLGYQLMMLAKANQRSFDTPLMFWPIDMFFGSLEIVHRARNILASGRDEEDGSNSHPPSALRREKLHEYVDGLIPEPTVPALPKRSDDPFIEAMGVFEANANALRQLGRHSRLRQERESGIVDCAHSVLMALWSRASAKFAEFRRAGVKPYEQMW